MTKKYFIKIAEHLALDDNVNEHCIKSIINVLDSTFMRFDKYKFLRFINKIRGTNYEI